MTALMGLDTRLRLARLYLCTDTRRVEGDLAEFLAAAFAGGVDIVQIRQPGIDPTAQLAALEVARAAAARYQGLVCANGNLEVAGRFGADVVHLSQSDPSSAAARRHLHQWALVGRSAHTRKQTDRAADDRATSYLWVGPVYGSPSASPSTLGEEPVGLDLVRHAAQVAPVFEVAGKPWFASGGITADNVEEVIAAGARRVCVGRAITAASDPQGAAKALADRLHEAWRADPRMERYTLAAAGGIG